MAAWLLCLWDVEVDGIILSTSEMEKQASLTTYPAMLQRLENAYQTQGNHFLLNEAMAPIDTAWSNQGDLPPFLTRWRM